MEGDVRTFAEMNPRDLENLSTNVTIEVSQEQGQRQIERADLALKSMDRYFAYPPEMRQFVKPMIKEIVKALGYENADEYLPDQAPDVPRDEQGNPQDKALQQQGASDAIRGMQLRPAALINTQKDQHNGSGKSSKSDVDSQGRQKPQRRFNAKGRASYNEVKLKQVRNVAKPPAPNPKTKKTKVVEKFLR